MKSKILVILLSIVLFFTTLSSSHPKDDQLNNAQPYIETASNYQFYNILIHVPAPSSDDYEDNP